jgi:hypothetical protein
MIRNLKILFGATLAVAAFGAIGASGAQAAEFHCSVEPCRFRLNSDGTADKAHHVFVIDDKTTGVSTSITCGRLTGEGRSNTKTFLEATVTNLAYGDIQCLEGGTIKTSVVMNECTYHFRAGGEVSVACPEGKKIEIVSGTGCVYTIGPQGPLKGITYTTIGAAPNREVTVSVNVTGIAVTLDGTKAQCVPFDPADNFEGTYTTGNTLVTAETDDANEAMADGWWA